MTDNGQISDGKATETETVTEEVPEDKAETEMDEEEKDRILLHRDFSRMKKTEDKSEYRHKEIDSSRQRILDATRPYMHIDVP